MKHLLWSIDGTFIIIGLIMATHYAPLARYAFGLPGFLEFIARGLWIFILVAVVLGHRGHVKFRTIKIVTVMIFIPAFSALTGLAYLSPILDFTLRINDSTYFLMAFCFSLLVVILAMVGYMAIENTVQMRKVANGSN